MKLRLASGLLFVPITLTHAGTRLTLNDVLVDTGSAGTLFAADVVATIGLTMEPTDPILRITGVGGSEFVFAKQVGEVAVGSLVARDVTVEIGALDYGIALDGILGLDTLRALGAVLDLATLELRSA